MHKTKLEETQRGSVNGATSSQLLTIMEAFKRMKSDFLYLLTDRDYILKIAEIHVEQANRGKEEIDELNRELKHVHMALDEARFSLQDAENQIKVMNQSRKHEDRMR